MKDAPSDSFPDGNARGDGIARDTSDSALSADAASSVDAVRSMDAVRSVDTAPSADPAPTSDPGPSADADHAAGSGRPPASRETGDQDASGPDARSGAGGASGGGRAGTGSGGGRGDGPDDPGAWPPGAGDHDDDDHDGRDDHRDGHAHDGLAPDEEALRRLLHDAVQDVRPGEGSLDRLRYAVPARRARKRQAFVGAAAAAVLLGAAVPALIHVSHVSGSDADRTAVAGHGQAVHGGTGGGKDTGGGRQGGGEPSGPGHAGGHGSGHGHEGQGKGGGTGAGTSPDPEDTLAARSPGCVPGALGNAQATIGAPDAQGTVYGTFRVSNVSEGDCTVDGAGTVATVAKGAADPAKITVVDHTDGDPAAGLPAPATQPAQIILAPGQSYEVKFAWVPSASCPSDPGASPDPTSSDDPTAAADGGDTGTTTQLYREDGTPEPGSVGVLHTAEPGAPTAATTIPNACAGTLYRTGLLPGDS